MSGLAALVGSRLQRIDGPHPDLIALTFHHPDHPGVLVVAAPEDGPASWTWLPERPRGAPASAFVMRLRKHLSNARVEGVDEDPRGATIRLSRSPPAAIRISTSPANVRLVLDGQEVGGLRPMREEHPGLLERRGPELVERVLDATHDQLRASLRTAATRRLKSLRRRLRAIEGDLARVDEVPELRRSADLLLAHLGQIPPGAAEAVVTDWHRDPPAARRIAIGAGRSAREEAEARYRRAGKLERGAEIALERHALTESIIAELERLRGRVASADPGELPALVAALGEHGARVPRGPDARDAPPRLPYRAYRGTGEREIRVGRSAADNDALTLRHAKPWDRWLHARGVPGSHVVIPLDRGEPCPDGLLIDAAHLAAHFSELRGETPVEIQHTARRHVVKPRGAAPGAVRVREERVILLSVEPDRLTWLLGRRRTTP